MHKKEPPAVIKKQPILVCKGTSESNESLPMISTISPFQRKETEIESKQAKTNMNQHRNKRPINSDDKKTAKVNI